MKTKEIEDLFDITEHFHLVVAMERHFVSGTI